MSTHISVVTRKEDKSYEGDVIATTTERHFIDPDHTAAWFKAATYIASLTWSDEIHAVIQHKP